MNLTRLTHEPEVWPCGSSFILELENNRILLECPLDVHSLLNFLPSFTSGQLHTRTNEAHENQLRMLAALCGGRPPSTAPFPPQAATGNGGEIPLLPTHKRGGCAPEVVPGQISGEQQEVSMLQAGGEGVADMLPLVRAIKLEPDVIASIDAVLLSTSSSMLGLPYVALHPDFHGKILATEPVAQLGQLGMEELAALYEEQGHLFPAVVEDRVRQGWLSTDAGVCLPPPLRFKGSEKQGQSLCAAVWRTLYSVEDVAACMAKVQRLRYKEGVDVGAFVSVAAMSSGASVGGSNWLISGCTSKVAYVSSFQPSPGLSTALDAQDLMGCHALVMADLPPTPNVCFPPAPGPSSSPWTMDQAIPDSGLEGGVAAICHQTVVSLSRGGSVLIPSEPSDVMLELLDTLLQHLRNNGNLEHIPIFCISPTSKDWLAYANIIPEWLSTKRQEKLYLAEPPFSFTDLLQIRLFPLPSLHCAQARRCWKEPCVIFASHWGLRMGAAVSLLHRWGRNPLSSLILTQPSLNVPLALAPFQPLSMEVLHVPLSMNMSRSSGAAALIHHLMPSMALVPASVVRELSVVDGGSLPPPPMIVTKGTEQRSVFVELPTEPKRLGMVPHLAMDVGPGPWSSEGFGGARVRATLVVRNGGWVLEGAEAAVPTCARTDPDFLWGVVEEDALIERLRQRGFGKMQIKRGRGDRVGGGLHAGNGHTLGDVKSRNGNEVMIEILSPRKAIVVLRDGCTSIEADDSVVRQLLIEAVLGLLHIL